MAATRKLTKELQLLEDHKGEDVGVNIVGNNLLHWKGYVDGPKNTPYYNKKYILTIKFPVEYPFKPPKITFDTKIFHPNISDKGEICLDILKNQWMPTMSMYKVLKSIRTLLCEPNIDDPLNPEAAKLYKDNRDEFNKVAY